jgi:predicted kinase
VNVLAVLAGLPRSGKSTWASQQNLPIVNPDSIRLAIHGQAFYPPAEPLVWAFAHMMVDALFRAGHECVILDATNVTQKRRDEWISKNYNVRLKVFDTEPAECIRRAKEGGREDLVPVIQRMAAQWDLPKSATWEEGLT